jgi:HD superfamily phosphohydrolase
MAEPTKMIRDPLWNTIRLSPVALAVVDTPAFQRLRYIRQLGFAHLVYPGATHTRFDHALGVYHLAQTALHRLRETSMAPEEVWRGADLIPYAALLHDIGHYAYSHALEELEADRIPADHEEVSGHFFQLAPMREALTPLGEGAIGCLHDLIRGRSDLPLRGLVSGSLDLDKMEYLRRDAYFCGVPFGDVDVDRLLAGLRLLPDPESGEWEIGVHEKAIAALESLLFAKYQMFRNVYWHHAVRAATALYKRIVDDAVASGLIDSDELVGPTDEELLYEIARRALEVDSPVADRLSARWIPALRNRRLPKRALELTAADLEGTTLAGWILGDDAAERRRVEDELAVGLGLHPGEVMVDFPVKSRMFSLDVLVRRRNGTVQRLGAEGLRGVLDLPRVGEELYRTARVLRVYTFERRDVDTSYWMERLLESASG